MKIQPFWFSAFFCALLLLAATPQPRVISAFADADQDGIDDAIEHHLAQRFFPTIWYMFTERCPDPSSPRPVLFRARYPSVRGTVHTDHLLINYVQLYDEDCGDGRHNGDNEPFQIFLFWNGSDWQFDSISANAHWDTGYETRTTSFAPELWIGNDKHGTYAEQSECGIWGSDYDKCGGPARTLPHALYNVGEPGHPLLDNLGIISGRWGDEAVWSDNQFLSAGTIRDQLYNDRFYILTPTPEENACRDSCQAEYNICTAYQWPPDPACDDEYAWCNNWCSYYWTWDR